MSQKFYLTHELMREPIRYYNEFRGGFGNWAFRNAGINLQD